MTVHTAHLINAKSVPSNCRLSGQANWIELWVCL